MHKGCSITKTTHRTVVEPTKHKVIVPLYRNGVCFGRTVGFEVVAAVLEGDSTPSFELFVVPLRNLCMSEQGVVAASKTSLHALSNVVVKWKVGAERVVGVLPVAVLRFVDGLHAVSYGVFEGIRSRGDDVI